VEEARRRVFPPSGYLAPVGGRGPATAEDLARLVACPRALASAHMFSLQADVWSMEEILCRAFPVAYAQVRWRSLIPLPVLDELSAPAMRDLWYRAAEAIQRGEVAVPADLPARFPLVYAKEGIMTLAFREGFDRD
jgi:hypothetical protein